MVGETPKWCVLVFATLTLGCASGSAGGTVCERGRSWWDRLHGACAPCTRCDPALRQAVKLPCELHRDTVCQSLYDVHIYPFNTRRGNESVEDPSESSEVSSDYEYSIEYDEADYVREESGRWDVEWSTLTLAASGCVVFFVVVLCMSLYHAKQWRILKQALKSDVQDLSAKLRLMESGAEPPADPVVPTSHHIYCNIHVVKESLLGPTTGKNGFGNVYTQEKHSS